MMTKELTNEDVAKALGWNLCAIGNPMTDGWTDEKGQEVDTPSSYQWTTSLDAITGEIERRGLAWKTFRWRVDGDMWKRGDVEEWWYQGEVKDVFPKRPQLSKHDQADTAPLALCKALISYLEENNGKS